MQLVGDVVEERRHHRAERLQVVDLDDPLGQDAGEHAALKAEARGLPQVAVAVSHPHGGVASDCPFEQVRSEGRPCQRCSGERERQQHGGTACDAHPQAAQRRVATPRVADESRAAAPPISPNRTARPGGLAFAAASAETSARGVPRRPMRSPRSPERCAVTSVPDGRCRWRGRAPVWRSCARAGDHSVPGSASGSAPAGSAGASEWGGQSGYGFEGQCEVRACRCHRSASLLKAHQNRELSLANRTEPARRWRWEIRQSAPGPL